jgi:site-specific recombinase XerC
MTLQACLAPLAASPSHNKGRGLAVRTVAQILARAVKKSGLNKRVTPCTFRHSMATHMLRNRADLRHIQAILGHAQLAHQHHDLYPREPGGPERGAAPLAPAWEDTKES